MNSDAQNDTSELRQHLYNLFGQNFLDGDKPSEWKATTMNASEVKEFIDEFVVPLIAQREQAAELRGVSTGMARAKTAVTVAMNTGSSTMTELRAVIDKEIKWWDENMIATKPEKEG